MLLLQLFSFFLNYIACAFLDAVFTFLLFYLPIFSTINIFSEVLLDLGGLNTLKIWGTDSLYSFSSQLSILNIVYVGTSAASKETSSMEKFQPVKVLLQAQKKDKAEIHCFHIRKRGKTSAI